MKKLLNRLVLHINLMAVDCGPLKLKELIHMNKKADQFDKIGILTESKKLIHMIQSGNKLQLVYLKSDYHLLMES